MSMEDSNVNTSNSTAEESVSALIKHDFSQLRKLCESTENEICTSMNSTSKSISQLKTQSVAKSTKFTKTYLFDQMKKIVKLCNNMCVRDSNTLDYFVSDNISVVDAELTTCRSISEAVEKSLKQHNANMEKKLQDIADVVAKLEANKCSVPVKTTTRENVTTIITPEQHVFAKQDDFLTADEAQNLYNFLSKLDYKVEKGHQVKNFGQLYKFTGAADKSSDPIPNEIQFVIDKIKQLCSDRKVDINQCLINA